MNLKKLLKSTDGVELATTHSIHHIKALTDNTNYKPQIPLESIESKFPILSPVST